MTQKQQISDLKHNQLPQKKKKKKKKSDPKDHNTTKAF